MDEVDANVHLGNNVQQQQQQHKHNKKPLMSAKVFLEKAADFFTPQTDIGRMVEACTSDLLIGPDWSANLHVCDMITAEGAQGAREGAKCIRKRMKNKNPKIASLALTLLETAMKNCGIQFHLQVAASDFMKDMQDIAGRKVAVDSQVQERCLELIQSWAEAFKEVQDDMPAFGEVYQQLKTDGIRFPPPKADSGPIINGAGRSAGGNHAPRGQGRMISSTPAYPTSQQFHQQSHSQQQQQQQQQQQPHHSSRSSPPAHVNAEKLKEDLTLVKNNCSLLSDIISSSDTVNEDLSKNDIVIELVGTCKQMHTKVQSLVEQIADEDAIAALLEVNDELNRVLEMYNTAIAIHKAERHPHHHHQQHHQQQQQQQSHSNGASQQQQQAAAASDVGDLLGLEEPKPKATQPMSLEEEFGILDLTRPAAATTTTTTTTTTTKPSSSPSAPAPTMIQAPAAPSTVNPSNNNNSNSNNNSNNNNNHAAATTTSPASVSSSSTSSTPIASSASNTPASSSSAAPKLAPPPTASVSVAQLKKPTTKPPPAQPTADQKLKDEELEKLFDL